MPKVLPISAVLLLMVGAVLAQDRLPASTQARLATMDHLEDLTLSDFAKVMAKAQSGDRAAQYLTALIYSEGRLVPRDLAAARNWMLKSAEQGYVPAQARMGETYLDGIRYNGTIPDYGEAERWLRLAAVQGDADAQLWLGTGYERGYFGAFDDREALKWLRMAAAQGLPNAQFRLGQKYEDGDGLPENDSRAASWYRKAADHFPDYLGGVREAVIALVEMYRQDHVSKDYVEEYMWFTVLGSVPDDDDDMKWVAQHMTKAQIAQARRMSADWIRRHRRQMPTNGNASFDHPKVAK